MVNPWHIDPHPLTRTTITTITTITTPADCVGSIDHGEATQRTHGDSGTSNGAADRG